MSLGRVSHPMTKIWGGCPTIQGDPPQVSRLVARSGFFFHWFSCKLPYLIRGAGTENLISPHRPSFDEIRQTWETCAIWPPMTPKWPPLFSGLNVVHIHQVSLKSDELLKLPPIMQIIWQFDLRWPQNDLHFFVTRCSPHPPSFVEIRQTLKNRAIWPPMTPKWPPLFWD